MALTALRKMGNSTGIILPRSILGEIGLTSGSAMDLRVEGGKLIGTPVRTELRAGWDIAAADIAGHQDDEAAEWQDFGNQDDADLTW